ncbi:MAG: hypothetical protein R2806_08610 [Saprospiraceae bacterium]
MAPPRNNIVDCRTDLVTGLVEPQEFLDFLAGKTSRQFVQDQTDLDARIQRFDHRSDPDGRYQQY